MPQSTLTYDLNDPDDASDFRLASNATEMYSSLHNIDELVRRATKGGEYDDKTMLLLQEIRASMPAVMWEV